MFNQQWAASLFGLLAMFSGGSLRRLTVFALGIMPYITASIILQLLTVVSPTLEKLKKEGDLGRQEDHGIYPLADRGLERVPGFRHRDRPGEADRQGVAVWSINPGPAFVFTTVLTLTTGAVFIMWLGEQITSRGIGNGMSLLIFAGIVVGLPRGVADLYEKVFVTHIWSSLVLLLLLAFMLAIVAFIVFVERGERRIPIQYAKRVVGRRSHGGRVHPPAAEGEQRRRDADHLCGFDSDVSTNHWFIPGEEQLSWGSLIGEVRQLSFAYGEPLYTLHLRPVDHVLCPLLPFDCL